MREPSPPTARYEDQPYVLKLTALRARCRPGHVYETSVTHDGLCDVYRIGGLCNCNPEVSMTDITPRESAPCTTA